MRACAALATEHVARPGVPARTRVSVLRSQAPLSLRPTHPEGSEPWSRACAGAARVSLAAGAAGPVGGDQLALTVDVGAGSTLVLREISASLLLPGPHGEQSALRTTVRVGDGATLIWLPQPVIAARNCHHVSDVRVELDVGARLVLREELLLGRHGEQPGAVVLRLAVRHEGRPLLHQHLALGPGAVGWAGAAVTGGHRALGSLVVVDPSRAGDPSPSAILGGTAAVMPLPGPGTLVSVLAPDALSLRRSLDEGLALLTAPGAAAG